MGVIGDIFTVASGIDQKRDRLLTARRDTRDRTANLFDTIAATLDRVVEDLKRDEVPHGACQQMAAYAQALPDAIRDELGAEEAERMGRLLERPTKSRTS